MIVWGSAGKTVDGGDAGSQLCQVCKERRSFRRLISYKMRHIWFLIRWSTSVRRYVVCDVCNNAFDIDEPVGALAGIESGDKPKNPIPIFDRWGWAFAFAGIAFLIILAVISSNAEDKADANLLESPQVGDLYQVDLDKFLGEKQASSALNYGVVRVSGVSGEKVQIDLPVIAYNRRSGASKDMTSRARESGYYNESVETSVAKLRELNASGAIIDVDRSP
jgi:hypothetical protein